MIKPINPIAKAMLKERRKKQVVSSKKVYSRKKEGKYADTFRENKSKEEAQE